MEGTTQQQIAFYLTGRREGSELRPMDASFRPALFARHGDLTSLRYDFPLVLNRNGNAGRSVLSLSRMIDDAIISLDENVDRGRVARHGYRLEHELRRGLTEKSSGDLALMWDAAAARVSGEDNEAVQDSARRLWKAFDASGDLVDVDATMPANVIKHAWAAVQAGKASDFSRKAERLLLKLRDILAAEEVGSAVGRSPERLKAGLGSSFAGTFDFAAMSRILVEAKPGVKLSDERRSRIRGLIDVLEHQRFYSLGNSSSEPYNFAFIRCSDALNSYQERHNEAVELLKTLAVAELEASGEYRESVHNVIFDGFGSNGLDTGELAELPDYLVCVDAQTLDPAETAQIVELLAAGLPFKVLVQTDDVLEPSTVAEGHVALGLRSRQLVDTAIGLTDVFVFQASGSHLFRKRDSLMRGLSYDGPALFSVFSGANRHTGGFPAYLVAAAAMESRAFPAMVYDPSAGSDWASRLIVDDNPQAEDDWPVHEFTFEDESVQTRSETVAFTLADFMAMDDRFRDHFSLVPSDGSNDALITVPEALHYEIKGLPDKVPCVTLVDGDGLIQRAIIDDRTLIEVRRCLTMWHSLQELGGIHNSHAERLLAKERRERETAATPATPAAVEAPVVVPVIAAEPVIAAAAAEPAAEESHGDEPYIEIGRCTTCNECTQVNNKMFAYNAEKQAYIADPDAGTFRQLVEAAEGCQVSIIHPGKPRNPKEPGLEDLIRRAAPFN